MKKKSLFHALPIAAVFAVTSCQKPAKTTTSPATPAEVVATPEVETVVEVKVDPLARSAKLGFAQMLPADTETLMLFQNGKDLAKSFGSSKFWEVVTKAEPDIEDMLDEDKETISARDILGEEFFLATGKNTAVQTGNLIKASERYTYHTMKMTISTMLSQISGDADPEAMMQNAQVMLKNVANDPEFGAAWLERAEMPPIYFGCKTNSDSAERIQAAFAEFAAGAASMGEATEEMTFEVSGHSFKGTRISGKLLVDSMGDDALNALKEQVGASAAEGLMSAAAKKNIIVASGSVNGYELILIGSRPEDFAFATTPAESLAATKELGFADAFVDKTQVALLFSRKCLQEVGLKVAGTAAYCDALRDALAANEKVDTREIEALLLLIPQREKDMRSMEKASDFGALVVLDQGLRIETFGGTELPYLDTTSPNTLGALEQAKDVAIFANWTSNKAYDEAASAYVETVFQTAYACAKSAANLDVEEESFDQYKEYFTLFDTKFAGHASKIWTAMSVTMAEGLGTEKALLVTLDGEMPPIPGVPEKVVKQGVVPRISSITAVKDRAKLAESWKMINESGDSIMKDISEMMGAEQAMPKPMSSQSNDLVTWFFPAPFFTDDFTPSITLNDKWFITSTSKKHAVQLAKSADSSSSGKTGAYISVDFDAFSAFGKKWFEVLKDNKEEMLTLNENLAAEFESNEENVSTGIEATKDLDQLEIHVRREGAVSRTTIHFKTH